MIRVLHIFHEMANGGVENFIMNYYRHIDRNKIQFDFLTSVEHSGYFDEEIKELGGRLFRAYPLNKNPMRNYLDIAHIVKENGYDIVHRHTGSAFGYLDLRAARLGGAKNLILHSHNNVARTPWLHKPCKMLLEIDCIKLACSKEAGVHLFGKDADFQVINNAIDCTAFQFSQDIRYRLRRENGIPGDAFVVGHVGRFEYQKNHKKLMSVFASFRKIQGNAKLVCIGDGSLLEETKLYAAEIGIDQDVLFLGNRSDVPEWMNTFDAFCLPSHYEGFGITLVEAQANGLSCVTSKGVVPDAVNVSGNVHFLDLDTPDEQWATEIAVMSGRDSSAVEQVIHAGFDISNEARSLQEFYEHILNGRGC